MTPTLNAPLDEGGASPVEMKLKAIREKFLLEEAEEAASLNPGPAILLPLTERVEAVMCDLGVEQDVAIALLQAWGREGLGISPAELVCYPNELFPGSAEGREESTRRAWTLLH